MKSGLPQRKERASVARRMGHTLHAMATENDADDAVILSAVDRVLGLVVFAGGSAAVLLWRGAEFTLGHLIVLLAAAAAAGGILWRGLRRRARTN